LYTARFEAASIAPASIFYYHRSGNRNKSVNCTSVSHFELASSSGHNGTDSTHKEKRRSLYTARFEAASIAPASIFYYHRSGNRNKSVNCT
ncbi:hypothetical protein, partial [Chryseobacterium sp. CH25]|uniref:hypothetical protein n=1 Tax=Chryseobacterium sp. CH25 TaxID=713559 RepID=UPI001E5CDEFE